MEKTDKKNQRRAGCYWLDGKPYLSVTEILKVIDKPALRYWYGKMVYLEMAKDPTLSEKEALAAPYKKSKEAITRGQAVHSIVEAWKNIDILLEDNDYKGYAQAFRSWLVDNHITVLENERTVVSDKYNYAGTLDLLVQKNGRKVPLIVDVKTGKDLYPEVHLQLSAYKQALEEMGKQADTAALLLSEDGTYKFETGKDKFREFYACMVLYRGMNEDKLERLEYAKESSTQRNLF
jgi:hypothetical protein